MAYGATETTHRGDIFATTLHRHGRKVVNAIYDGIPFTKKLTMKNRIKFDGGDGLRIPVRGKLNPSFAWIEGYDTVTPEKPDQLASAIYQWNDFTIRTAISEAERADNAGVSRAVNLLRDRLKDTTQSALHALEKNWYLLTAPNKAMSTLNQICNNANAYRTYAGIDGNDADNAPYWKPQTFTQNTVDIKAMKDQQVKVRGATKHRPDICLMDASSYIELDELAFDKRRYNDGRMADLGFEVLELWGTTFMFTDEASILTNQTGKSHVWYWLTSEFLSLYCHSNEWMKQLPPIRDKDQPQVTWYNYYSRGQLVCTNRRRMGLSTGT